MKSRFGWVLRFVASGIVFLAGLSQAVAPATPLAATSPSASATNDYWTVVMPPADPLYDKWEAAWQESQIVETDITRLRHEIAFLQIMREMDLSKEQLKALLPIEKKAQEDSKFSVATILRIYEHTHAATIRFWNDTMIEDITPKKKTPTIAGNFDRKTWDDGELGHNYCSAGQWTPNFDPKQQAVEFEKILTPAQLKKAQTNNPAIGRQLQDLRSGTGVYRARMVTPYWVGSAFSSTETLAEWRKELPHEMVRNSDRRPILSGVLLAPHALNWVERQLGLQESNGWPEEEAQVRRTSVLLRYPRRSMHRQMVSANWTKGLRLTQKQTEAMLGVSRKMCELYIAEVQDYVDKGKKLTEALTKVRDLTGAGKPIPQELAAVDAELGPQVAYDYLGGPLRENDACQDGTFRPRSTGIWKMFPEQTAKLMGEAESILSETQKIVLWDVHGNCYKPWEPFTSPIAAGGVSVTVSEYPMLKELRGAGGEQVTELMDKLASARVADREKLTQQEQKYWPGAEFVSLSAPYHMLAGQSCNVSVAIKNTGGRPWTADGKYQLGLESDALPRIRVDLGAGEKVEPGQTKVFQFALEIPDEAKAGYLRWRVRMLREENRRENGFGQPAPDLVLTVHRAPEANVDTSLVAFTPENSATRDKAWFIGWMKSIKTMSDAEYQTKKYELSAVITGNASPYGDATSGIATAEQNGQWPTKIDWDDPAQHPFVFGSYSNKGRLEARVEFLLLPDAMQFYYVRSELMKQFKMAPPADLDKLPSTCAN